MSSHVTDFNTRNKFKLVNFSIRAIGIINFKKPFSKFYSRHYELVSKFKVGLKSLLQQGLSEPKFCVGLVYKVRKKLNRAEFSSSSETLSCVTNVLDMIQMLFRQSACIVINPITVESFATLNDRPNIKLVDLFKLVGTGLSLVCCLVIWG